MQRLGSLVVDIAKELATVRTESRVALEQSYMPV